MAARSKLILAFVIAGFGAGLLLAPYMPVRVREDASRRPVEPPDSISVFYTCDTRGHINPCDCSSGVAGGLPRRKTFIAQQRTGDALIVDAGNVTAGGQPWELLELDYVLRAYGDIGYHAVNVGKTEVGLPAKTLVELNTKFPLFVSANVLRADGTPIFPAYRTATLESGYRIAVMGVFGAGLLPEQKGDGISIAPPDESIAKALPNALKEADLVVLLAYAGEDMMRDFAERFFEIAVIVGGDVEQPSGDAIAANKSTLVYITDKGKSVGKLDLRYIGGRYIAEKNSINMLTEMVHDDPGIGALANDLHLELLRNHYPTEKDDEDGLSRVK